MNAITSYFEENEKFQAVWDNLTGAGAKTAYQWISVVFMLILALVYGNATPLIIAGTWIVLLICVVLFGCGGYYLITTAEERSRELYSPRSSSNGYEPIFDNKLWYWLCAGSWFIMLIVGTFVMYHPINYHKYPNQLVLEHAIGGTETINQDNKVTMFVPLVDKVRRYSGSMTTNSECLTTTKDGYQLSATVSAELKMPDEQLLDTHEKFGNGDARDQKAEHLVCARLDRVVSEYNLVDLPSTLLLEHHTGADQESMNEAFLQYHGTVKVANIHAYIE